MEIINQTIKINTQTLTPELEVTLKFPMDSTQDNMALDPNFFDNWAREFFAKLNGMR